MKATLLFPDREIVEQYYVPLIYTACRTCYSELEPEDIFRRAVAGEFDPAKQQKLIRRVIESGHGSTIEHIVFTFAHQRRDADAVAPARAASRRRRVRPADAALPQVQGRRRHGPGLDRRGATRSCASGTRTQMDGSLAFYGEMLEAGLPGEDARFVMPNATRTNLVMTANLRALIHMSGLRLCTMAQWEIRRLFQLIRHEIFAVSPFLGSFLAPKCVPLGYCDEIATATSTARSGRTRTTSWPPGPRRPPRPRPRAGSCRRLDAPARARRDDRLSPRARAAATRTGGSPLASRGPASRRPPAPPRG